MAEDWIGAATDVSAGISSVGFDVTFKRRAPSGPSYDDDLAGSVTQITVKAVDVKPKQNRYATSSEVMADRAILVGAVSFVPDLADKVAIGGVEYGVLRIRQVRPGDVVLLYRVELQA